MLFPLIDNCIMILLSLATAFQTEFPELLVIAAGIFVVVITADSMGIRLFWLKGVLCPVFALLSGSWIGFLSFSVLPGWRTDREEESEGKNARGVYGMFSAVSGFIYLVYALVWKHGSPDGQLIAKELLLSSQVMLGNALVIFLKYFLHREQQKRRAEQQRLRSFAISEMHVRKLNRELAQQSFLADKNARLTERENISRNIHNSVGHTITAAIMTLDAADMLYEVKPEEARRRMNDANQRIRGSLESIRRAVRTLDEESKDVPLTDLIDGMKSILDEFVMDTERRYDLVPEDFPAGMLIPHEYMEFLTGVLSEMLTNGVKHGKADRFHIHLTGDSGHIRLSVRDNGQSDYNEENAGARLEQGFGLKKIVSYAERCGGFARFRNEDGFRAEVELPIIGETGGDHA